MIEDWQKRFPNMRWDFPTEIVLPQFSGRVVGNAAMMLPAKLALLRLLAATFECRVICCARDFYHEEDRLKPTAEEIEAEMAEEFPSDEELDQEEWESSEHFKRLEAWERGFGTTAGKQLLEEGISLPPPTSLSDEDLPKKLWQIILGLADKNTYLHSTNHLDDRALYTWLWQEGLSDNIMSAAGLRDSGVHLDILCSGAFDATIVALNWVLPADGLCVGILLRIGRHQQVNSGVLVSVIGVMLFAIVVCWNLDGELGACGRGGLTRQLWW